VFVWETRARYEAGPCCCWILSLPTKNVPAQQRHTLAPLNSQLTDSNPFALFKFTYGFHPFQLALAESRPTLDTLCKGLYRFAFFKFCKVKCRPQCSSRELSRKARLFARVKIHSTARVESCNYTDRPEIGRCGVREGCN